MPTDGLLVFRVKAAVHWAAGVGIVVAHVYVGSAKRKDGQYVISWRKIEVQTITYEKR